MNTRPVGIFLVATALFTCLVGFGTAGASAAAPAPAWSLQSIALPTNFSSGRNAVCEEHPGAHEIEKCNHYTITPFNIGTRSSTGAITIVDTLPVGLGVIGEPRGENEFMAWTCTTGEVGERAVVTCDSGEEIQPLTPPAAVNIDVKVEPTAHGTLTNRVEISGGGAASPAVTETPTAIDAETEVFAPLTFEVGLLDAAGAPATQAGAHPGGFTTSFSLPSAFSYKTKPPAAYPYPLEDVKQIVTDLPAGVIGDALAAATCPLYDVTNLKENQRQCPFASRVGKLVLVESAFAQTELVIFNVTPEHGYAAEFAVYLPEVARAALLYAKLVGTGAEAHVRVVSAPQNSVVRDVGVSLTLFGDPAVIDGSTISPMAFFANPSDCEASGFTSRLYVDSWQHPGRIDSEGEPDLSDPNWKSASSTSPPVTGCEGLHFEPTLTFAPEQGHSQADEPSGYESRLRVPQNEDPNGLATPPLKTATVTLPAGVAISPAAADGLLGCQASGPEGIELESNQVGHCPSASKVGSATVLTPLLKEPLEGGVFVAQPGCSPCSEAQAEDGEVFALYLEVGNENSGVHIKLKGRVEVGGSGQHSREVGLQPGQIRTTFAETPQQPFSELKLNFAGGPRAPLANPQSCGTFSSAAELEPWSHIPAPGEREGTPDVTLNPSFAIAGCEDRFAPGFSAGTVDPQAGGFSPFTLTFSRQDREQDLAGLSVSMPEGLIGKVAGHVQCPEPQASAGSCPAASRVGTVTAAAGSGSHPFWQSGPVYLTGPYRGAPFGLSVVVPAVAGPFNLGNIVVRAAIGIDPHTARVSVASDPLPQSVDGVPLRVKTVNVTVGGEGNFTFNPTSCEPSRVSATITGAGGASVPVATRFQAANCASLPFKPSLTASTSGRTNRANGASLDVKLVARPGEANVRKVDVQLPLALPSRLTTLQKACTEAQFAANPAGCPAASDVGTATVRTPLLNAPLTGPAYFVSHGGAAFPDLDLVLQGEGVTIVLTGNTNIKKGITYSRFESVPDAPFTSFELNAPQGPHSILAANVNLCAPTQTKTVRKRVTLRSHGHVRHLTRSVKTVVAASLSMPTTLVGQNGAQVVQSTKIAVTGCPKVKKASKKKATTRHRKGAKGKKK